MKWIYDGPLITRQVLAWTFLIAIWAVPIIFVLKYVPMQFVAIPLGIIAIPVVWQFFFSDRAVLKAMHAAPITEQDDPRLYRMVRRLARQADLPMPKIAIVNTVMPNAFATGRSKNHSVVAVTRGIYEFLNDEELEAVIAHELSHIKNADMATMTVTTFLSTVAMAMLVVIAGAAEESEKRRKRQEEEWWSFDDKKDDDNGLAEAGEALFLLAAAIVAGLLYLLTAIFMNLLSRYRELAADRGSVLITGNGDALISALQKIEGGIAATPKRHLPSDSSCNLYYIIPAAVNRSFFSLFSTHPTLEKRIRNIAEFMVREEATIEENRRAYERLAGKRSSYSRPKIPQYETDTGCVPVRKPVAAAQTVRKNRGGVIAAVAITCVLLFAGVMGGVGMLGNSPFSTPTVSAPVPELEPLPPAGPPYLLTVETVPAGAEITFDGVVLGYRTPVQLTVPDANPHTVTLRMAGYRPVTASITLTANMTLSRVLEAGAFGTLKVSAEDESLVYIDNVYRGKLAGGTGIFEGIDAGEHNLRVEHGSRRADVKIDVKPEETCSISVGLAKR